MTDDSGTQGIIGTRHYRLIRAVIVIWMTAVIVAAFSGGGVLLNIPRIPILEHTARNLYFHVPMWFTMMALTMLSAWHSLRVLQTGSHVYDLRAKSAAIVAVCFGILGLLTGSVWARWTWYVESGLWWNFDPKQSMAAIQVLIYAAYFALRNAVDDEKERTRIAAAYNLLAFITVPFLLYVLPRQMESLHPGAEGNPAFSEITDPILRVVFYAAVIGFIGLAWLLYTQRVRIENVCNRIDALGRPDL